MSPNPGALLAFQRPQGVALNDAPPPVIRHRILDGAEEALRPCRLVDLAREAQLDRIELDRVGPLPLRAAVHEPSDRPGAVPGPSKASGGHELGGAGRHDVDEALALIGWPPSVDLCPQTPPMGRGALTGDGRTGPKRGYACASGRAWAEGLAAAPSRGTPRRRGGDGRRRLAHGTGEAECVRF